MHRLAVLAAALTLAFSLPGCGEKDAGVGGSGGAASSKAKTPGELIDLLEAVTEAEAFSPVQIVALLHPDEQPAFALTMSMLPVLMSGMMAAFAQGEEKAKIEAQMSKINALFEKHGLSEEVAKSRAKGMGGMGGGADAGAESPADKIDALSAAMKGVDHMALLKEAWGIFDSMQGDKKTTKKISKEDIAKARASLKIEGDRATIDGPDGGGKQMVFVKAADGYWYISAAESGLLSVGG